MDSWYYYGHRPPISAFEVRERRIWGPPFSSDEKDQLNYQERCDYARRVGTGRPYLGYPSGYLPGCEPEWK